MCRMDSKRIISEFQGHLKNSGKRYYSDFYVGVSKDAQERMFDQHKVDKNNNWWIYRTALNSEEARVVEKFFLEKGMRGGDGGGDDSAIQVYCYAVSPKTIE